MLNMKKKDIQKKVTLYFKEAIILNNCLQSTKSATYCPPGLVDGEDGDGNVIYEEIKQLFSGVESVALTGSNMLVMLI